MPRSCSICVHPDREKIDGQLLSGATYRGISRNFAVSEDALYRHKSEGHIVVDLAQAHEVKEIARADSLLDQLKAVRQRTDELLTKAEEAGEVRSWPGFLRELREQIKLLAELEGRLAAQPQVTLQQVNIYSSPEWRKVGDMLLEVLDSYPELRHVVAERMLKLAREGGRSE
jgi:hypothetical protein